jgi:hypothetical protein
MVSQGTGYFLNQNTILTNWHVIRGAKEISMITIDGTQYTGGEVTSWNYACGVAAVRFSWDARCKMAAGDTTVGSTPIRCIAP